jgi:hypothetical protein
MRKYFLITEDTEQRVMDEDMGIVSALGDKERNYQARLRYASALPYPPSQHSQAVGFLHKFSLCALCLCSENALEF